LRSTSNRHCTGRCGENVLVGGQQIGIAGHLQVRIGIVLGHGLGGRLVVYDHGVVVLIHQQQVDDAHQHELRGQTVIGVKPGREGQFHLDDGMAGQVDGVVKGGQHGLAHGESTGLVGHVLFPDDWVPAFFSSSRLSTASNVSMQGVQRLLVAAGFQGPVKQLLGGVHGFTEWQGDADAFRFAFLDIVKPVFEATVEVGEYLE
jgi:hypothetical protein